MSERKLMKTLSAVAAVHFVIKLALVLLALLLLSA
jgi:hypothetical protein